MYFGSNLYDLKYWKTEPDAGYNHIVSTIGGSPDCQYEEIKVEEFFALVKDMCEDNYNDKGKYTVQTRFESFEEFAKHAIKAKKSIIDSWQWQNRDSKFSLEKISMDDFCCVLTFKRHVKR